MRAVLVGVVSAVLLAMVGGSADGRQPEKIDAKLLVGKWEQKSPDGKFTSLFEFSKDGKLENVVSSGGKQGYKLTGKFKLEGDKLGLTFAEDGKEIKMTWTVLRLTQTELRTRDGKAEDVWTRVKDNK
ncbi:MAG TPA: TIGR03066 family protein [Urbifossiella sp.]|nr:TIGR03066 family protein [Urbifossiella sp.]